MKIACTWLLNENKFINPIWMGVKITPVINPMYVLIDRPCKLVTIIDREASWHKHSEKGTYKLENKINDIF